MADFILYLDADGAIQSDPHSQRFPRKRQTVTIENTTGGAVVLWFCEDLRAKPNPLEFTVADVATAAISINPVKDAVCLTRRFKGRAAVTCPTCGTRPPRTSKRKIYAGADGVVVTASLPKSGSAAHEGDPVIIIRPSSN
jgi:hypothetical protein